MRVFVYLTCWDAFWDNRKETKNYVACWSLEDEESKLWKVVISTKKLCINHFKNLENRPFFKFLGEFETKNYPLLLKNKMITSTVIECSAEIIEYDVKNCALIEIRKLNSGWVGMFGSSNVEEALLIIDALSIKEKRRLLETAETIEEVKEALKENEEF